MVEVSEMELDLGLSIGGTTSRRSETTSKPVEIDKSGLSFDSIPTKGCSLYLREVQTTSASRSSTSPAATAVSEPPESAILDQKTKREIQALRRQEAKKKQREKRSRGLKNSSSLTSLVQEHYANDVSSAVEEQRASKREKAENNNANPVNSSNGPTLPYHPVTAVGAQYTCAPVQFVPYANGFAYPCVMPCWRATTPTLGGGEKNVIQPVPCRGFGPFLAGQGLGLNISNGFGSEYYGGKHCEIKVRKTTSDGSPACSSSSVSYHRSSFHEGDDSSDTRTRSSHSSPEQNQRNDSKANDYKAQSEVQSACSHHAESEPKNNTQTKSVSQPVPPRPTGKPISTAENSSPDHNDSSLKETKVEIGKKLPMSQPLNRNETPPPPPIQKMPYVSTRGNGPNGKTVSGFLYNYTSKSEVSIVCVCHGSTFSPAGFVEHAGGTDVSQPLKQITVIPSAFG
ncbi:Ninja family [Parasponia andersonii]|uniref:Ninja-family protein n=1 Tax=Parasponia andersonii TaxID=3476 RepID=A0A2P5AHP4_PARAD|nr:Ninja family [Parasponia andersonii]